MQLSMQDHRRAAFFLAIGAGLMEFIYTGFTVAFFRYLIKNGELTTYFLGITGIALIILGIYNLFSKTSSRNYSESKRMRGRIGFSKGVLLGLLNPMTVPFWLAVTSYLVTHEWISLEEGHFWLYISGLAAGTICLLWLVDVLGNKFKQVADNRFLVHVIPGVLFIAMGIFNLLELI